MNIFAFGIGNLGGPDLFIVLLIVLILFGAKKLPDLARSLGQSMNEFRKAREDIDRELHNAGARPSEARDPASPRSNGQSLRAGQIAPATHTTQNWALEDNGFYGIPRSGGFRDLTGGQSARQTHLAGLFPFSSMNK